jgi:hypothetical protein
MTAAHQDEAIVTHSPFYANALLVLHYCLFLSPELLQFRLEASDLKFSRLASRDHLIQDNQLFLLKVQVTSYLISSI